MRRGPVETRPGLARRWFRYRAWKFPARTNTGALPPGHLGGTGPGVKNSQQQQAIHHWRAEIILLSAACLGTSEVMRQSGEDLRHEVCSPTGANGVTDR